MVYSNGNPKDVVNHRGISFGKTIGKIVASVLDNRLCEWVNERIMS